MVISKIRFPEIVKAQYILASSFGSKILANKNRLKNTIKKKIKRQATDWNIYKSSFF